jgi:hypothetical protein
MGPLAEFVIAHSPRGIALNTGQATSEHPMFALPGTGLFPSYPDNRNRVSREARDAIRRPPSTVGTR